MRHVLASFTAPSRRMRGTSFAQPKRRDAVIRDRGTHSEPRAHGEPSTHGDAAKPFADGRGHPDRSPAAARKRVPGGCPVSSRAYFRHGMPGYCRHQTDERRPCWRDYLVRDSRSKRRFVRFLTGDAAPFRFSGANVPDVPPPNQLQRLPHPPEHRRIRLRARVAPLSPGIHRLTATLVATGRPAGGRDQAGAYEWLVAGYGEPFAAVDAYGPIYESAAFGSGTGATVIRAR